MKKIYYFNLFFIRLFIGNAFRELPRLTLLLFKDVDFIAGLAGLCDLYFE